jgi:hypothetical protein
MNKNEWKQVTEIRIRIQEGNFGWSFPIKCPRWLFNILSKLEI